MPLPMPEPFPCTVTEPSAKFHDDAARAEPVAESRSNAWGSPNLKRMLNVERYAGRVNGSKSQTDTFYLRSRRLDSIDKLNPFG